MERQELIGDMLPFAEYIAGRIAKELGAAPSPIKFSFESMSQCLNGQAYSSGLVKLNIDFLLYSYSEFGGEHTYDEAEKLIAHEICHVYTPGDHHGAAWRAAMIRCGYAPETRTNAFVSGVSPDDSRATFSIGCTVEFVARGGDEVQGTVVRHNRNTFSVMTDRGRYRVPWTYEQVWLA